MRIFPAGLPFFCGALQLPAIGKKTKQNPPSSGCSTRTFPGERVGKTLEMLRQVAQRAARQVFAVIHPRIQRPTLAYV